MEFQRIIHFFFLLSGLLLAIKSSVSAQDYPIQFQLSAATNEVFMADKAGLQPFILDRLQELDRIGYGSPNKTVIVVRGQSEDPEPTSSVSGSGAGSGEGNDLSSLAEQSQNPIANLASIPIQNNFDRGVTPGDRTRYIGNLQPVVPFKLNEKWNLIARAVIPFVNIPVGEVGRSHGLGDSFGQFFFVPRTESKFTWGIGPSVLIPTASDPSLGFQEWGAGVDAVALVTAGPIVTGALVNQIWSVEGNTKPFLFQPFFNYNFKKGWFLTASGEFQADWERSSDRRWNNVFGGGVGRTFPLFGQPVTMIGRFAPYLKRPTGGPDWQFRFQLNYLFPKK